MPLGAAAPGQAHFHPIRAQTQHERGFVFTSMGQIGRLHEFLLGQSPPGQMPIRGAGDPGRIVFRMFQGHSIEGFGGRVHVASMTIQQHDTAESRAQEAVHQILENLNIGFALDAHGSGESQMVMRTAHPKCRQKSHLRGQSSLSPARHLRDDRGVGNDRQMPPVLLHRGNGQKRDSFRGDAAQFRRGQFSVNHGIRTTQSISTSIFKSWQPTVVRAGFSGPKNLL